ncbi:MAG TPA: agmatinase [Spirochaetia bacterium]|nr:agmatinase [Spirochaetia bacterium]
MTATPNFLGLEPAFSAADTSRYHILPVPYDGTSTWRKGADKGPAALLEASTQIEHYDIETDSEAFRRGIHTHAPLGEAGSPEAASPEALAEKVQAAVAGLLAAGRFPVVVGGEHSVSIGAIRAAAKAVPDLTVLQLDAHADLRESYQGSTHNHACVMARAREAAPIVQVGIRSADREELQGADRNRIVFAEEIYRGPGWMKKAISHTTPNVYLTIDLDVFDPSVMPATGTPEPGGLSWYQVISFLRMVVEWRQVAGFDVVELCPNGYHHAHFTAAKLVYKLISYHAKKESSWTEYKSRPV